MFVKRHFKKFPGWEPVYNMPDVNGNRPDPSKRVGECLNPPPLDHIQILHTGKNPEQNFSDRLIDYLRNIGMAQISADGHLTIDAKPEPLHYKVLRTPGRYCCICGKNLNDDSVSGEASRAHVRTEHPDVRGPAHAPAGYERIHAYECVLEKDQHAKYCFDAWDAMRKRRVKSEKKP